MDQMIDFDIFIGIDWSGAKYPIQSKAISLSWCGRGDAPPQLLSGALSRRDIANWILEMSSKNLRMMVGIDCNLGYSSNVVIDQFGSLATAMDLWCEVEALNELDDNFHAEQFWKNTKYKNYFWTTGKQPNWYHQQDLRRITEQQCISSGLGIPECPFKFIGPKQVGKGGFSGMRLAYFLAKELNKKICIWPFQEIESCTDIILTEIYPRLFWNKAGMGNKKVRNISDLNKALSYFKSKPIECQTNLSDHNTDAIITAVGIRDLIQSGYAENYNLFNVPDYILDVVRREGWIFGVDFG